jgi:hypothetical protein
VFRLLSFTTAKDRQPEAMPSAHAHPRRDVMEGLPPPSSEEDTPAPLPDERTKLPRPTDDMGEPAHKINRSEIVTEKRAIRTAWQRHSLRDSTVRCSRVTLSRRRRWRGSSYSNGARKVRVAMAGIGIVGEDQRVGSENTSFCLSVPRATTCGLKVEHRVP